MSMPKDLRWLAENVSEWGCIESTHISKSYTDACYLDSHDGRYSTERDGVFSKSQWQEARRELGLEPSRISEEDEESAIQEHYERLNNDSGSGQKFDGAKAMMDLIPPYIEEEVAMVLTFGAKKYAPGNWRKVDNLRSRYLAASQRHINAIKKGENRDPESGLHHAAHAICCLMFLAEVELEQDDD